MSRHTPRTYTSSGPHTAGYMLSHTPMHIETWQPWHSAKPITVISLLFVSVHYTQQWRAIYWMAFAAGWKKSTRERKPLQTSAWFMKSISCAVSAPHCVCVLQDRHKLHTLCKRKIPFELNNDRERRKRLPRNQLQKLNIKNTKIIVCGKAICLQLGDLHISQSAEKGNRTLMEWQRPLRHFKIQPRPDV